MNEQMKIDGKTLRREKARKLPLRQRRALNAALVLARGADRVLAARERIAAGDLRVYSRDGLTILKRAL